MARTLLVLDEVLAMLQVVGVSSKLRDAFRVQALAALKHKGRADAPGGNDSVTVSSGFGRASRRGFVELTINETLTQMDAAKAREILLDLRELRQGSRDIVRPQ